MNYKNKLFCEYYHELKKDFHIRMSPKQKEPIYSEMTRIYEEVKKHSKYHELKRTLSCAIILENYPYISNREMSKILKCHHVAIGKMKKVLENELNSKDEKMKVELDRLKNLIISA